MTLQFVPKAAMHELACVQGSRKEAAAQTHTHTHTHTLRKDDSFFFFPVFGLYRVWREDSSYQFGISVL